MPRPRFAKLAAEQQETILRAALAEFATYGFTDASLNRIIEASGISKGSLYYYFDGKEDLYAFVARREVVALIERAGPFRVPAGDIEPEEFWTTLSEHYLRLMRALLADRVVAAIVRGWVAGAGSPRLQAVEHELEQAGLSWFLEVIAAGQRIGAVRTDLPDDLLLAVLFGLSQAMDRWLIGSRGGEGADQRLRVEEAVPVAVQLVQRALQP